MPGKPQGQVTWGRPGAWPYACPGHNSRWGLSHAALAEVRGGGLGPAGTTRPGL